MLWCQQGILTDEDVMLYSLDVDKLFTLNYFMADF